MFRRSLNLASNFAHPNWPWLTPQAVRFLDLWLKPTDTVFEWGAGRSTLWIARRVRQITSVEHDPAWFARVKSRAARQNLHNIELKFYPDGQASLSEPAYVAAINQVRDQFDLVVVDGLRREQCALAAIPKLKADGILLLDNANWYLPSATRSPASRSLNDGPASVAWAEFAQQVSGWRVIWTTNGVTDTAMWVKPTTMLPPGSSSVDQHPS
jgi:predicted O-methyltransferase YrrM